MNFIFLSIKCYREIYFRKRYCKILCIFLFYFDIYSLGRINSFTGNNFLPRVIKKESYSSPFFIYQNIFALNMRSIKNHRRNIFKVLIMLFIKQFYAAHWLVMNISLAGVIGQKDLRNIHKPKYQSSNTCLVMCFSFLFSLRHHNTYTAIVSKLFNLGAFAFALSSRYIAPLSIDGLI